MANVKTLGASAAFALLAFNANADDKPVEPVTSATPPPAELVLASTTAAPNSDTTAQQINFQTAAKGHPVTMTFGDSFDEVDVNRVRISLTRANCELNPSFTNNPELSDWILIETVQGRAIAQSTDTAATEATILCLDNNS